MYESQYNLLKEISQFISHESEYYEQKRKEYNNELFHPTPNGEWNGDVSVEYSEVCSWIGLIKERLNKILGAE